MSMKIPYRLFCQYIKKIDNKLVSIERLSNNLNGVAVLKLNRADKMNALNHQLTEQLNEAFDQLKKDNTINVLVIRSLVPKSFCAGADLTERLNSDEQQISFIVNNLRGTFVKLENLPMPTIAAIDGIAMGGGLEMALACDIRVASNDAKLGLAETRLGIHPGAGGTQSLPRIINKSIAKELIYTAEILDGNRAAHLGIVNHVVPQNGTRTAAYEKSLIIAAKINQNAPVAVKMAKQAINRGTEASADVGYAIEGMCYARVIPTKDRVEGLKAFVEKRKPTYTGE